MALRVLLASGKYCRARRDLSIGVKKLEREEWKICPKLPINAQRGTGALGAGVPLLVIYLSHKHKHNKHYGTLQEVQDPG